LPELFDPIHDFLSNISFTLIFDRTSDVILLAVHRRLFPAHPYGPLLLAAFVLVRVDFPPTQPSL
jgi:hypothetical protein